MKGKLEVIQPIPSVIMLLGGDLGRRIRQCLLK
jgi:hypothetical protein